MRPQLRAGLSLVEVLVIISVLAVVLTLLLAAIQQMRPRGSFRYGCQDNLKNIVLGCHNYATSHGGRLPGFDNKTSGGPGYRFNARFSMYADVLPYVEFESVYDRLNYRSPEPFVTTIGLDPRTARVAAISPSATPAKTPGEFPPSDAAGWVVGAKDPLTANKHYEALQAFVPIFYCPADRPTPEARAAIAYPPLVTAGVPNGAGGGRFGDPRGPLLEALWPPDDDSTMSGPLPASLVAPGAEGAGASFFDRLRPWTLDELNAADGAAHTIGFAERLLGKAVSGREEVARNVALTGAAGENGYVVDANGSIAPDDAAQVAACRALAAGGATPRATAENDLAGAVYFQHTCAWLGCVNAMAPPNTPVCRGWTPRLAQTGLSSPSSNHGAGDGAGANVGVMDGSVRFLTNKIDLKVMHAYGTPDGREKHPDLDGF